MGDRFHEGLITAGAPDLAGDGTNRIARRATLLRVPRARSCGPHGEQVEILGVEVLGKVCRLLVVACDGGRWLRGGPDFLFRLFGYFLRHEDVSHGDTAIKVAEISRFGEFSQLVIRLRLLAIMLRPVQKLTHGRPYPQTLADAKKTAHRELTLRSAASAAALPET
jgi:hypothetical protein